MEEKKNYIIVNEYNTWCSTLTQVTMEELKEEVKNIRQYMKEDGLSEDTELIAFEFVGTSFRV